MKHFIIQIKKIPLLIYLIIFCSLLLYILFFLKNPGYTFEHPKQFGLNNSIYGSRDAILYTKMAKQLVEQGVFGYDYLETNKTVVNAYVTPGHPLYLSIILIFAKLFHTNFLNLSIMCNMILNLISLIFLYLICESLFKKKWIGIISVGLYAFYLPNYYYFRTLLTETPSIFLFIVSMYLIIKAIKTNQTFLHILFGIVFSILLMFRPNPAPLILIVIPVVFYLYGIKKSIKIGLLWMIGPIIIICPWVIRNFITLHQFVIFSTQAGNPLLAGTDPFNIYGWNSIVNGWVASGLSQQDYAILRIKDGFNTNPALWFSWFTIGKTFSLYQYPSLFWEYKDYVFYSFNLFYHKFIIYTTIITSIFLFIKTKKNLSAFIIMTVLIEYTIFTNLFLAIDRYGYFVIFLFCILSSYGIDYFNHFVLSIYKNLKGKFYKIYFIKKQ